MVESGISARRYEELGELGRGSMAIVHRARDCAEGREVALKVYLRPNAIGEAAWSEFCEKYVGPPARPGDLSRRGHLSRADPPDPDERFPAAGLRHQAAGPPLPGGLPGVGRRRRQGVAEDGGVLPHVALELPDLALVGKDAAYDIITVCLNPTSTDYSSVAQEIKKRIDAKYPGVYQDRHTGGWSALWMLTQAIEKAQSLDPVKVADTFSKMDKIEGVYGPATMGGLKALGVNNVVMQPRPLIRIDKDGVTDIAIVKPRFFGD